MNMNGGEFLPSGVFILPTYVFLLRWLENLLIRLHGPPSASLFPFFAESASCFLRSSLCVSAHACVCMCICEK